MMEDDIQFSLEATFQQVVLSLSHNDMRVPGNHLKCLDDHSSGVALI